VGEALRLSDAYRQPAGLCNAIRLRDWLREKSKDEISLREIMQFGPAPLLQKAQAEAALATLVDYGHLTKRGDGRGARWALAVEATQ
jgi:hypothetical protein